MLKSLEDIEFFMQNNLMILAEMIRKIETSSDSNVVVPSAVEAFMIFCRRQREKGKDWLQDLGLEKVLKEYYNKRGEEMKWEKRSDQKNINEINKDYIDINGKFKSNFIVDNKKKGIFKRKFYLIYCFS